MWCHILYIFSRVNCFDYIYPCCVQQINCLEYIRYIFSHDFFRWVQRFDRILRLILATWQNSYRRARQNISFYFFSSGKIHFLFFLLRQNPGISLFIRLLLLFLIHRPPPVLLLDQEHDGQDGEAAEGKHVAEPLDTDVGDCENAQKDHTDYVVPDKSKRNQVHTGQRIVRKSAYQMLSQEKIKRKRRQRRDKEKSAYQMLSQPPIMPSLIG